MQCVWLWGVGQEIIDFDRLIEKLSSTSHKGRQYYFRDFQGAQVETKNIK